MTITIKIDTGNAAFGETAGERSTEVERIIREDVVSALFDLLDAERSTPWALHDYNGNKVGTVTVRGK